MISKAVVPVLVSAAIILAFSCDAHAQNYDVFKDYDALKQPRSAVPIGARWIERGGPTGAATATDNIEISTGVTTLQFSNTFKSNLKLSLFGLLGLSRDQARTINVNLSDIEIHRVRDVTKLAGLTAGQRFLAVAIKAKRITVSGNANTVRSIAAQATNVGLPVNQDGTTAQLNAGSTGSQTLTLDGSNLFVAYKLLEFTAGTPRTTTTYHAGKPVTVNGWEFRPCLCSDDKNKVRFFVKDLMAIRPDGEAEVRMWEFPYGEDAYQVVKLPVRLIGNDVEYSSASLRYNIMRPCFVIDGSSAGCFRKEENNIELTTSKFSVRPYRDNGAPY